jgi:hypothetical protein
MRLPEYVTIEEVKRVCKELNIRDWTQLKKAKVAIEEASVILVKVNIGDLDIAVKDFQQGLEVELEHGIRYSGANVTNNHPILTGQIVLAHFHESLDYYKRLDVSEIEGDLLKAIATKNTSKFETIYRKLIKAKLTMSQAESDLLKYS